MSQLVSREKQTLDTGYDKRKTRFDKFPGQKSGQNGLLSVNEINKAKEFNVSDSDINDSDDEKMVLLENRLEEMQKKLSENDQTDYDTEFEKDNNKSSDPLNGINLLNTDNMFKKIISSNDNKLSTETIFTY